jgi:hypothetical protein
LVAIVVYVDIPAEPGLVSGGSIGKTLAVRIQRNRDVVAGIRREIASRSSGSSANAGTRKTLGFVTSGVAGVFFTIGFGRIIAARTSSVGIAPRESGSRGTLGIAIVPKIAQGTGAFFAGFFAQERRLGNFDAVIAQRRAIIKTLRRSGGAFGKAIGHASGFGTAAFIDGVVPFEAIQVFGINAFVITRISAFDRYRRTILADINVVAKIRTLFSGQIAS